MNNKDDKKPVQAKDAAATGLGPVHNKPGAGGPPKYVPFDPVPGDLPPYPSHPGFGPGYPPAHPGHPGGPAYPGYPDQPGFAPSCQGMELARAYICIQSWGNVNSPARALETGTLFPELYRPYPY
ncbi:Spore coat associated protein JA (CotJA) [Sporotomaculum syntrophicum]|uniref:Spore coat associated protein JA (CotJA) n=1 Tax=Sporotomaculum syntrophicum TaxID=182264 RepID=A0A9D2WR61_9FIRM|nr:spore coat associated protein CotJA [Sporotomaculum syntrophicum]KAF1085411.1 Spore coat associated protein JA (CotJA) [Sporotomaculum syntrophicum]